jgi:anti-sigma-K factor RskA
VSEPGDRASAHDRYRDDLAAYALGALEGREAADFRRHLGDCDACRQQLRWFEPAVDLLPRSVRQREPPARLRKQLMDTVRAESRQAARADPARRRRRDWGALLWRPATAVAATTLLAVGAVAGYLIHQPADNSSVIAANPTSGSSAASGALERQDGTAILHVEGMPALARNQVYEVWVKRGGRLAPASLFVLRRNHSGDAAIPGPLQGADAVLVTREPRGGSRQPTSRPLLQANLH